MALEYKRKEKQNTIYYIHKRKAIRGVFFTIANRKNSIVNVTQHLIFVVCESSICKTIPNIISTIITIMYAHACISIYCPI